VHLVGFVIKKFVTTHGHMNVKFTDIVFVVHVVQAFAYVIFRLLCATC